MHILFIIEEIYHHLNCAITLYDGFSIAAKKQRGGSGKIGRGSVLNRSGKNYNYSFLDCLLYPYSCRYTAFLSRDYQPLPSMSSINSYTI